MAVAEARAQQARRRRAVEAAHARKHQRALQGRCGS
jgi:hypothetical protein